MTGKVAIVIPLYKDELEWFEKIAMEQAVRVFNQEDMFFLLPAGADYDYIPAGKQYWQLFVPATYLTSTESYSRLMLSPEFYEQFFAYEYILIYQLDAFVFQNQLREFCALGYDYYGAPWPWECGEVVIEGKRLHQNVGNGGFSLRKVKACHQLVKRYQQRMWDSNMPEDVLIAYFGNMPENDFCIAPISVAYRFSAEINPLRAWHKNGQQLPFGCHGWHHYSRDFYQAAFSLAGVSLAEHEAQMESLDLLNQKICYRDWLMRRLYKQLVRENPANKDIQDAAFQPLFAAYWPRAVNRLKRYMQTRRKKIVVVSVSRAEDDILESFVRHTLTFADEILMEDSTGTDTTERILQALVAEGLPIKVRRFASTGPDYAEIMNQLVYEAARVLKADLILPLAVDEFLINTESAESVRAVLQQLDDTLVYHLQAAKIILGRRALVPGFRLLQGGRSACIETSSGRFSVESQELPILHLDHYHGRSLERFAIKVGVEGMTKTEIFFSLAEKMEQQAFDDEYLLLLIDFWQDEENAADGNIFYARYALAHGNYEVAFEYAMKAFAVRKINWTLWDILRDCYLHQGNIEQAMLFAGFADSFYNEPVKIDVPRHRLQEALNMLSLGKGIGGFAPIARFRMVMDEQGLTAQPAIYAGEFLPEMYPERPWHFWVGAYSEQEMLDYKGQLLEKIKDDPDIALSCAAEFVFDVVKSREVRQSAVVQVQPGEEVLVPLAGLDNSQRVSFQWGGEDAEDWLGKWTYSYFRFNQDTRVSADAPFIMGKPVKLGHSPQRKKVVLNILVDALCWRAVRERNYDLVPNMLAFFQKGIIFDEHHSVSEYTYPSLPSIETGLYPWHNQIFNEKASHAIDPRYETISEQMQKLGYYCVHILSNGNGIYTGSTRGYDREIINPYALHNYVGVERVIQHLEAFGECDQFLFMHTGDTHPWAAHTFQLPIHTQTCFDLKERSLKEERKRPSVYLPKRPLYLQWNEQCIRDMDRAFKVLFDYLETHYSEDEYILQIYSDHGVPIYDDKNYVLSVHQTGAAYMMRGAGIPALGFVQELTSAVDIYPALAHCMGIPLPDYLDGNLPAALGGQEREYVISMSIFPGTPLMVCIRTKEWECQAESVRAVDEDGRADLDEMKFRMFRRFQPEEVQDENLRRYFAGIIEKETAELNNHGRYWPNMKAARPEWFAEKG